MNGDRERGHDSTPRGRPLIESTSGIFRTDRELIRDGRSDLSFAPALAAAAKSDAPPRAGTPHALG